MGEQLKKCGYKISLVCFILISLQILYSAFFVPRYNISIIQNHKFMWAFALFLMVGMIFAVFLLIQRYCMSFVHNMTRLQFVKILIAMGFFMMMAQILFCFVSRNFLRYDALLVFDEAMSFFSDGGIDLDPKDEYFARYTNNHAITIMTFLFLKVGRIFHLVGEQGQHSLLFLQIINVFAIDLALFAGMALVWEIKQSRSAVLLYMIVVVLCPLNYVWCPFYYTNTISMPFMMLSLWLGYCLFLKNNRTELKWRTFLTAFVLGMIFVLGFLIRATLIITFIAIVCSAFLVDSQITLQQKAFRWGATVLGILIMLGVCTMLHGKYVEADTKERAFPAMHWIMMGARENGGFNKHDEEYTRMAEGKQAKKEADLVKLKERLYSKGILGTVHHLFEKMDLTFGDGTGEYDCELETAASYGSLYRIVYGDCKLPLFLLSQAMYIMIFGGCLFHAVRLVISRSLSSDFVLIIHLLGAVLFYALWEAGTVYSIGFLPIFYSAFAIGYTDVYAVYSNIPAKTIKWIAGVFGFVSVFIVCVMQVKSDNIAYQVKQIMFETDHYMECGDDIVLNQTFQNEGTFNHIALQVRNPWGELNESVYEIALLACNQGEECLESWNVNARELIDCEFMTLELKQSYGAGNYQIRIRKLYGKKNLIFLYYDTGNFDIYPYGELTGFPFKSTIDLTFKVYQGEEKEDYFRKTMEQLK